MFEKLEELKKEKSCKEIALEAGVSASSIYKCLNHGILTKRIKNKIMSYLEELDEEDSIYNDEYREALHNEIKQYKTFIVTTAVSGKRANEPFVKSLLLYAKHCNALPIILPCEDVASRGRKAKPIDLDEALSDFKVVFKGTYLNKNLHLSAIKCSAKQINPLTGLNRIPRKINASIILASPKRHLKYMPSMENPAALMTPGAVTVSNYDTDKILSQRCSALAELDHVCGAIIVEIEDENIFHFRGVTSNADGSFTDTGVKFYPDGKACTITSGITMVLGDSHTGSHDEKLLIKILEIIDKMQIDTLILHDVFNATSISHHIANKFIEKAIRDEDGKLSLKDELQNLTNYLKVLKSHVKELVIVDSNHDRHLERYLQEQRYVDDIQNIRIASKLIEPCLDGKNVVQYAVEEIFNFKDPNVKWLKVDESYKKYGVELGIHGDLGANGGKGNIRTYRDYIGNCVVGHSHSGCILDEAYSVGTTSELRQGYNKGLSNWTRTCCLIYPDGTKQLVNFILNKDGEYSCGSIV